MRGSTTTLADADLTYDSAGRHVATTYTDGSVVTLTRDVTGRVVQRTVDEAGPSPAASTRYLYAGAGDSPYATVAAGSFTQHVGLPGGVTVAVTGAEQDWSYPGILGHTVTTGDGVTAGPVQLFDPFGQPLHPATRAIGGTTVHRPVHLRTLRVRGFATWRGVCEREQSFGDSLTILLVVGC